MTAPADEKPAGKGRPTPKRREAEKRRKATIAPKSRKEASKLQRELAREKRANARKGMQTGDARYLPKRDAGPARAYVRDYVDSRRHAASYFMPFMLVVLVLSASQSAVMRSVSSSLMLTGIVLVVFDGMRLGRKIVNHVTEHFPSEATKGLKLYAVTRAMQFRRLRMPKPRVKVGESI